MKAHHRVENMETILNHQLRLMDSLTNLLAEVEASQADFDKLLLYYQSSTYMEDLKLDEDGHFNGLPRGVLSEDGVYHLLFDRQMIAEKLREVSKLLGLPK